MRTTKTPTESEAWLLLASLVFDHRGPWRTQVAERIGMPFSRFRALRRLEAGPMPAARLAEQLEIDAAATSVVVTDLADRGLLTRTPDPTDGRRKILALTDAGREVLRIVREEVPPAAALHALTPDELATLHALLLKMQGATR